MSVLSTKLVNSLRKKRDALAANLEQAQSDLKSACLGRDKLAAEVERLKDICEHQRQTLYFLEGTEDGAELHACDARHEEFEKLTAEVERLRWFEKHHLTCDMGWSAGQADGRREAFDSLLRCASDWAGEDKTLAAWVFHARARHVSGGDHG